VSMAASIRTCIGCRRRAPATELVRLVAIDGRVRPGPRAGQTGRGASIHPRETCVATAVQRRAFARAFRLPVSPGGSVSGREGRNLADADAAEVLLRNVEVAYVSQQPRSR
jgi:predicted RNA-binding protein YlxR (DUF448 family)